MHGITVEPPKNGHVGILSFVLSLEVKNVAIQALKSEVLLLAMGGLHSSSPQVRGSTVSHGGSAQFKPSSQRFYC